jgi:hypothetical protein
MGLLSSLNLNFKMKVRIRDVYVLIILLCCNVGQVHAATQALTLSISGSGGGSVNSIPSGIACTSGSCQASFGTGTSVSLIAIPNSISNFTGWSGACTTTSANCSVTMNTDNFVSANFTAAPKAMIGNIGYASLADAYFSATNGENIKLLATDALESLTLNKGIAVTITGGYNAGFTSFSGLTMLDGPLIISSGSLTANGLGVTTGVGTYSISGVVSSGATLMQGVAVTLSGGSSSDTVSTGSLGDYSFAGIQNGTYTLSAAMPGYTMSANQPVTVNGANVTGINFTATALPLLSIAVTPAPLNMVLGGTQQFKATGTYSDNSTQDLTASVTWNSSNPSVATIATSGLATAVGVGTSTITATSGNISGPTTLTVFGVRPTTAIVTLATSGFFTSGTAPGIGSIDAGVTFSTTKGLTLTSDVLSGAATTITPLPTMVANVPSPGNALLTLTANTSGTIPPVVVGFSSNAPFATLTFTIAPGTTLPVASDFTITPGSVAVDNITPVLEPKISVIIQSVTFQ